MSRADRSADRDILIYDAQKPDTLIGGLCLIQEFTNANIYAMLDIFVVLSVSYETESPYTLRSSNGESVQRDNAVFKKGTYFLEAASKFLRE